MNFDVVLLPSFSAVDDWRRQAACAEASGLFGQTVSTFHAWICDLWDEYGDGRAIINSVQRAIFMEEAFIQTELFAHEGILDEGEACGLRSTSDSSCEPFVFSPGVVCTACECARLAFGLPAFEKTLDFAAHNDPLKQFSAGESTLLEALLKYKTLIQEEGLIELGQALAYLAEESRDFKSRSFRVLIDRAAPLDFQMNYFFEACSRIDYEVRLARGNQGIERAPEGVSIRFGCPTGPYAQAALVSDVLEQYDTDTPASTDDHTPASQGQFANSFDTIITCRDPLSFYQRMQPACKRLDVSVCVQTKKAFPLTDFGRHFLALASFQQENAAFIESLSDALLPPFSGLSQSQAYQVDVQLRSDRIIDVEAFLAVLRAQSDTFSQLEELASTPEADVLLGVFEQIVHASSKRCEAWRAEQLAAISALRAFTSAARSAGLDMSQCTHLLERFFIRLAFEQRAL